MWEVLDRLAAEISDDDLLRCFSLGEADLELVWDRGGAAARLAGGLQIGALRLIGFVPADLISAPLSMREFVAAQVDAEAGDIDGYSDRRKTRWEHAAAVERHVGFRRGGASELKELDGWLGERAVEHDRPLALFTLACDHLMTEGVVRPGITTVERAVVGARSGA